MQDFKMIWGVLNSAFAAFVEFIIHWAKFTMACHLSPSIPIIAVCFLSIAFLLGSGFIAATVAELKEKNRFLHFIGGICFPYFYPAAIYYFIPAPNEDYRPLKDVEKEKREIESKRLTEAFNEKVANDPFAALLKPKIEETQAPQGENTETKAEESAVPSPDQEKAQSGGQGLDQNYFASISINENGEFNGPFMIDFKDGRIVEASRILSALPEAIEIETVGDGDIIRKIRVPYSKISGCTLKSNWMGR